MTADHSHRPKISSRCFGHGPRRALALHCTIAHSGAWRGVAAAMETEATFTTPDMLSHGRSPDWDGKGDFPDIMTAAVAPLLDEPMDVIGHSFGALIALRLAVEYPDLVRTLTLIEPVFFAVAAQDAPDLVAQHSEKLTPFWDAISDRDHARAARLFNRSWGDGGTRWPDLPEAARAAMTRGIRIVPACDTIVMDDRTSLLNPGKLEALTMPVLLLRGGLSDEIIQVINDGLARRLKGAQNIVIQDAGHMLPVTHPAQTARAIRLLFEQ